MYSYKRRKEKVRSEKTARAAIAHLKVVGFGCQQARDRSVQGGSWGEQPVLPIIGALPAVSLVS